MSLFASYSQTGKAKKYINLQNVNNWDQILTMCYGFLCCFTTIKFLQILEFSDTIALLGRTLKRCFKDMISFSFMFFVVYMAFVQLMYLVYYQELPHWNTLTKSMECAFVVVLGSVEITNDASWFERIIYTAYNCMITFYMIALFMIILMDAFAETQKIKTSSITEGDLIRYLGDMLLSMIPFKDKFIKKEPNSIDVLMGRKDRSVKYMDHVDSLSVRTNQLLSRVQNMAEKNERAMPNRKR
jgi:hypothetical protein